MTTREASMTPTNEAAEPWTEAGRKLAARAKRESWGNWEGIAQYEIPTIERQASEAAPSLLQERDRLAVSEHDLADTACFLDGHARPSDRSACDGCEDWAANAFAALRARLAATATEEPTDD